MGQERKDHFQSQEAQRLGPKFREICDGYGLEDPEVDLIDSVLAEFSGHNAGIIQKLRKISGLVLEHPKRFDITGAFTEINHAYMERDPFNSLGRLGRKSYLN